MASEKRRLASLCRKARFPSGGKRGIALIMVIFLMLMCGLVAVSAFSLLSAGVESGFDSAGSAQAYAIASGGKEWYLEQLQNDTNWANQASQTNIPLGAGSFDVIIQNASSSSVSFVVVGNAAGLSGQTLRRQVRMTAKRSPSASFFGLFWGRDTGASLSLRTNSIINGDFWSAGSTVVNRGCSVTRVSYCPTTKNITGTGTFTNVKINPPAPAMPQINTAYYDNFMTAANANIVTYGTNTDTTLSTNLNLTGGFYGYRTLTTRGNITISGHGTIVAGRDVNLHSTAAAAGTTLTIAPSGGNITILSGRSINVNSTTSDASVLINGNANNKVYLYSQDSYPLDASTTRLVYIRKPASSARTTQVNHSVIIGGRRIIVRDGAQVLDSTLYVGDVTDTNNNLQIIGSGTAVGTAGHPCNVISVSGANPGLLLNTSASVTGFVYHWGGTTGTTAISTASITGSLVASQFQTNRITTGVITYDEAALPLAPDGFESFVSGDIDSWNDQ